MGRVICVFSLVWLALGLIIGVPVVAQEDSVERGRYLARAADCVACHTAEDGMAYAGGRPFHTPFGTLYSTNITPDKDTGIGNYSLPQFDAAVRRGKSPHGNLYPAMPYTSYYHISDRDIAALYQYFMQLPPLESRPPKNKLMFPANIRWGLSFWNWLYFDPQRPLPAAEEKDPEWRRGQYLVHALGHCGECHTPRNFAQAMERQRPLAGNVLEGWDAVDISARELQRQGWTREQLRRFLTSGSSERGTAFGEMASVVQHSLRHLNDEDMNAMLSYLLDGADPAAVPSPHNPAAAEEYPSGRGDYIAYCAGCHGREGRGLTLAFAPPMNVNAGLRGRSPYNLIAVILRGLPEQRISRSEARAGMPGFSEELSDQRVAELVNFMRGAWGGDQEAVGADQVSEIRRGLVKDGYLEPRGH